MAEAIARRRGDSTQVNAHVGVEGEITVNTTDNTVHVHGSNPKPGGHPLAKADCTNINTSALATSMGHSGKNLMYNDLSNLNGGTHTTPDLVSARLQEDYGLVSISGKNLNTSLFSTNDASDVAPGGGPQLARRDLSNVNPTVISGLLEDVAKKDMSNVDTASLAETPSIGEKLAYADTSNIDTTDLATGHDQELSSGDKNLAYADLSNVNMTEFGFQTIGNMTQFTTDLGDETKYPSMYTLQEAIRISPSNVPSTDDLDINDAPYFLSFDNVDIGQGEQPTVFWNNNITPRAGDVIYDNSTSGLESEDIQNAIDELKEEINFVDDEISSLSTVASTGSYNDLLNKPTIPAAQVNSDWNATSGKAQILNKPTLSTVATSGSYNDLSDTPVLSTVATTGNYNDLSNKPVIPGSLRSPIYVSDKALSPSYYVIYSDGWVEQGGLNTGSGNSTNKVVSLSIVMNDLNYLYNLTVQRNSDTDIGVSANMGANGKQLDSIAVRVMYAAAHYADKFSWEVKGYGNEAAIQALVPEFSY